MIFLLVAGDGDRPCWCLSASWEDAERTGHWFYSYSEGNVSHNESPALLLTTPMLEQFRSPIQADRDLISDSLGWWKQEMPSSWGKIVMETAQLLLWRRNVNPGQHIQYTAAIISISINITYDKSSYNLDYGYLTMIHSWTKIVKCFLFFFLFIFFNLLKAWLQGRIGSLTK